MKTSIHCIKWVILITGFLTSSFAFAVVDKKVIPGSACHSYIGAYTADLNHYSDRIENISANGRWVTCPIVRDNVTNVNGFTVEVRMDRDPGANSNLVCAATSWTPLGGFVATGFFSYAGAGPAINVIGVGASAPFGHYNMICYLPPNSSIFSYMYTEDAPTDFNN